MATPVKVPSMGESITSGIIAAWKVKNGEYVERDQVLYELETDKITSEGIAETPGKITLKVEEGAEVEIGQVVAEIDEKADASKTEKKSGEDGQKEAPEVEEEKEPDDRAKADSGTERKPSRPAPAARTFKSSPAVRRIAEETGIDPDSVHGSGKGGRVTKADMLEAAEKETKTEEAVSDGEDESPPDERREPHPSKNRETRTKLSSLRRRIAERLVQSQQQAAILSTFNEVDLTAVRDLRSKFQDRFVEKHGLKLGFMSFFVKAAVYALKEVPQVNARLEEGNILVQNHYYDIGVAVGTEKGLLVPVLRNCDALTFAEIESTIAETAKKARDGKIAIEDLEGGVFTISNGGIYGSLLSTPIINPPQSGILGMHTIQDRPVAVNGEVVIRPMMYLALSYDHRIVDGKEAVTFLIKIKQAIEEPSRLLLDL